MKKSLLITILLASVLLSACSGISLPDIPAPPIGSAGSQSTPSPSPTPKPTPRPTPEPTPVPPVDVAADGSFTLYGKEFNIKDRELNINHINIDDNGELVAKLIPCMPNLKTVDMDTCGVDNEHMAALRDSFPDIKIVWRVWFGSNYTARTDVEKILASCPGGGGNLTVNNTDGLKYCTDVKYLDIGHNEYLYDVSFLQYMPKLEVLIIAMDKVSDISCLENCPHMEFLEIQTNNITDLTPLQNMKELRHLNIARNPDLADISPLYGLRDLERLWIGSATQVPQSQIDEMQRLAPNCVINTTVYDPHTDWRYGNERYELLIQQFGYDRADYAYPWRDPKYLPDGQSW